MRASILTKKDLFEKDILIDKIGFNEYIRRGVTLSLVWSLLEYYKQGTDRLKSIDAIQSIVIKTLAKYFYGYEDEIETMKANAWERLFALYSETDDTASVINIIEEIYYQNFDWMNALDMELDRPVNYLILNMIDGDGYAVRSRTVADQYKVMMNKEIFEYQKNIKRAA
jgi:hypothetical protein